MYFIDPVCWVRYKLALGLAVPTGHGAEACAEAAWVVLRRYGIRKEDIDRSMNDTTNASVATGRLLAGRDGTCGMHVANLVADHASGKRVRTEKRIVVDDFPPCENLRVKLRKMIKYVFSKKAKARSINYTSRNAALGATVIRIGLDNDTRISGTHRMFQQVLRMRFTLQTYFNLEAQRVREQHMPSDEEFQMVAQFEAVMRPICDLSFETQTDSRVTAGTQWLDIVR